MSRFAFLVTYVDIGKLKYYEKDLKEVEQKMKYGFRKFFDEEPKHVWPMSFMKPPSNPDKDEIEEEEFLIKRFDWIRS